MEFTNLEEKILIRSGERALTGRMKRAAFITALLFLLLLIGTAIASRNVWIVLAVAIAYLLVTLCEKIAYINAVSAYRALIVKLSTRVNELEKKG